MAPWASMESVTVSGFSGAAAPAACGRSSLMEWVKSGAVMMKITSNTSITSTMGVTLMSAMGAGCRSSLKLPKAMVFSSGDARAGGQIGMQIVGEGIQFRQRDAIDAGEGVIGQHRRNRHGKTQRSHDQRLAHGACHLVDLDR